MIDPEFLAMRQAARVLDRLKPPQARRVLAYLHSRYLDEGDKVWKAIGGDPQFVPPRTVGLVGVGAQPADLDAAG